MYNPNRPQKSSFLRVIPDWYRIVQCYISCNHFSIQMKHNLFWMSDSFCDTFALPLFQFYISEINWFVLQADFKWKIFFCPNRIWSSFFTYKKVARLDLVWVPLSGLQSRGCKKLVCDCFSVDKTFYGCESLETAALIKVSHSKWNFSSYVTGNSLWSKK